MKLLLLNDPHILVQTLNDKPLENDVLTTATTFVIIFYYIFFQ